MDKIYPQKRSWVNSPSVDSPINATNLNAMDVAIYDIDTRVINLDYGNLKSVAFTESTGKLTFTKGDGSTVVIDTKLEKLAINFTYDPATQRLVITLDDGTKEYVDLSALINEYDFLDGNEITWAVQSGKVSASIKNGSIAGSKLEPNYLANCQSAVASASTSETNAKASELNAKASEDTAKAYSDSVIASMTEINKKLNFAEFDIDSDGNLIYTDNSPYSFSVNDNGLLEWEVSE